MKQRTRIVVTPGNALLIVWEHVWERHGRPTSVAGRAYRELLGDQLTESLRLVKAELKAESSDPN